MGLSRQDCADNGMKILLADDHFMVRVGLKLLLTRLIPGAVIIEARDYTQALSACAQHNDLRLILLDRLMPGMDERLGLIKLREALPDVPLVILSASEDSSHIWESLEAGARGYIPKSSTEEVMQSALQLVLSGGTYLPPALIVRARDTAATSAPLSAQPAAKAPNLTARQIEVLKLLVTGRSNKQIANSLNISEATVCTHVNAIFRILDVNNRTEAVHAAARCGVNPP